MARPEIERWRAAVVAQLDAVRRVDSAALAAVTEERRLAQAAIEPSRVARWTPEELSEARRIAIEIRGIDARIRTCGNTVIGALAAVMPDTSPGTYGRRGQLRSA